MPVNVERLNKLANLLDGSSAETAFDLRAWGRTEIRRRGFLWLRKAECGTRACAVGLACISGAFAADGLRYARCQVSGAIMPIFGHETNWPAVKAFFGLTSKQAQHLFDAEAYEMPVGSSAAAEVAHRIRGLVRRSENGKNAQRHRRMSEAVQKIKAAALAQDHGRDDRVIAPPVPQESPS